MISSYETCRTACCDAAVDPAEVIEAFGASVAATSSSDEESPRMVEILTVLNDVFDSFCAPAESGVLAGARSM
jgi:hypothetical protein